MRRLALLILALLPSPLGAQELGAVLTRAAEEGELGARREELLPGRALAPLVGQRDLYSDAEEAEAHPPRARPRDEAAYGDVVGVDEGGQIEGDEGILLGA